MHRMDDGASDIVGLTVKKHVMIEWRTFSDVVVDVSEFTEAIHAESHA